MRGHVKSGHDMIVRALGYRPSYAHIIAEHHERCDGSGYPAGRAGSGIALDSQLVGIVDAFDALTSRRSYRTALSASRRSMSCGLPCAASQRRAAEGVHQAARRLQTPSPMASTTATRLAS